jgi:N-methylhydantoinase B
VAVATDVYSYRAGKSEGGRGATIDPVTTQLVRHGLEAAAEQMGVALRRTAFSPMIYDTRDYAGAIYDRDVRLLAQMRCLPTFVGTLNFIVDAAIDKLGGADILREGDVVVSSYGYDTGSHSLDVGIVVPVFLEGELVGYVVNKAHNLDLGAKAMFTTDSTDIWQEGTIYPSVRLYKGGELDVDLWRTMLANSRLPDALAGDINAQIGACRLGLQAYLRVLERYTPNVVWAAADAMFDHSERAMRNVIRAIPDGLYRAAGAADNDGITDELVPYQISIEVRGDEMIVDLTNAPDEAAGPINAPLPTTVACVRCAVMAIAGVGEGANEGHFRPIEIRTRPGSIFHALPPAPIFMFAWPLISAIDHIHRALAEVLPNQIPAQTGCDVGAFLAWGTRDDGSFWGDGTNHAGGQGAALVYGDGGGPMMHISCSGTRNNAIEIWEARTPFLAERVDFAEDSGGAGRFRGGPGLDIHYRALRDLYVTVPWERVKSAPFGLFDGGAARPNRVVIEFPDGTSRSITKASAVFVPSGSLIKLETGGGGGLGDPREREAERVHADVVDGFISEDAARRDYPHAFGEREAKRGDGE